MRRLSRRLGRRGAFLLTFGAVMALVGVGTFGRESQPHHVVIVAIAPLNVWAAATLACGLVAILCAWLHHDWPGFVAVQVVALAYSAGLAAALFSPLTPAARAGAVTGTLVWALIAIALAIVGGWPEISEPP